MKAPAKYAITNKGISASRLPEMFHGGATEGCARLFERLAKQNAALSRPEHFEGRDKKEYTEERAQYRHRNQSKKLAAEVSSNDRAKRKPCDEPPTRREGAHRYESVNALCCDEQHRYADGERERARNLDLYAVKKNQRWDQQLATGHT